MKVVYHENFNQVYTSDPAAAAGRMEAVVDVLKGRVTFVEPEPAEQEDIERVHTAGHIASVRL